MIVVLSVVTIVATAQTYKPLTEKQAMENHQVMMTGNAYNGTVYEPFSSTTPSEQSAVGASYSPAKGSGPRKLEGFNNATDTGQSGESPIGDAVLPLMLFAGAFLCMRVFLKRKRALSR